MYKCRCECGRIRRVEAHSLRSGRTKSCGCIKRVLIPNGTVFGRLTLLGFHHSTGQDTFYKLRCKCGNIKVVKRWSLINGMTMSCGCLHREIVSRTRQRPPFLTKNQYSNYRHKCRTIELTDGYVASTLRLPKNEIPQSIIDAKRLHIKIGRLLKDNDYDTKHESISERVSNCI
jgi:hypothetical protein